LSPVRAALRRLLLPYVRSETPILHAMQVKPCARFAKTGSKSIILTQLALLHHAFL
jgi:hypothetical protein